MSGFQGKKNVYTCDTCGRQTVTVDRDDGTTPFMIDCTGSGCKGYMQSSLYRVDQALPATHEWYRPALSEMKNRKRHLRDHVERGGLLLREIGAAS